MPWRRGILVSMIRLSVLSFTLFALFIAQALAGPLHSEDGLSLSDAALERTRHRVTYDGSYQKIAYPMGDVAADRGVCADVVIRAYRALGIDLQERIHKDMTADYAAYPDNWNQKTTDTNIDHRRVPNIRRFLERQGASVVVTQNPKAYHPGDLVTWDLGPYMPHIGIVTDQIGPSGNPMVVHNIGAGPKLDDALFRYQISGHYRYLPSVDG